MELQLNVNVRYAARHPQSIGDVLRHFESPAWVRLVLRQVLPQLKQISPTDTTQLTKMVHGTKSSRSRSKQEFSCAICMTEQPTMSSKVVMPLELPCGHRFHSGCVQSWLKRRSTCPLCRFQLPKAYTGTFAIAAVLSTLLLSGEYDKILPSEIQVSPVGGRMLQVAVTIIMARIEAKSPSKRRRPCQVSVAMVHANGSTALKSLDKRRREVRTPDAPGVSKRVKLS